MHRGRAPRASPAAQLDASTRPGASHNSGRGTAAATRDSARAATAPFVIPRVVPIPKPLHPVMNDQQLKVQREENHIKRDYECRQEGSSRSSRKRRSVRDRQHRANPPGEQPRLQICAVQEIHVAARDLTQLEQSLQPYLDVALDKDKVAKL
ncbi:hypothetical protein AMAG_14731 [Allomyces macrogynus ATCC 38327]|uniref:Uncharacterized protein n=1 Tax=Allomyces macrogynus (strain ATCC 38327) TaxID=578462 RepID=A0A0L0T559_ALLM3|nr:hypothetical protein AMAG_14731 [Allomyces macrogynus ATCC 38327]|eukprot:KNE69885.1 hypothetical protein AMAG_14731 [Allomyces macrogynus ATCC 38327]